jgi:hypothetical protein
MGKRFYYRERREPRGVVGCVLNPSVRADNYLSSAKYAKYAKKAFYHGDR